MANAALTIAYRARTCMKGGGSLDAVALLTNLPFDSAPRIRATPAPRAGYVELHVRPLPTGTSCDYGANALAHLHDTCTVGGQGVGTRSPCTSDKLQHYDLRRARRAERWLTRYRTSCRRWQRLPTAARHLARTPNCVGQRCAGFDGSRARRGDERNSCTEQRHLQVRPSAPAPPGASIK